LILGAICSLPRKPFLTGVYEGVQLSKNGVAFTKEVRDRMTRNGLSKAQAEVLGVFLLGKDMQARYAGYDNYDVAEDDEPAVRIPGATFRVLLDYGYLERTAPRGVMLRWRISAAGRTALSKYPI
jgi:hypothetical protein